MGRIAQSGRVWVTSCLVLQLVAVALADPAGRSLSQATCGALGAPCCAGTGGNDRCPAGFTNQARQPLACAGSTCVACGGPAEVCCQQFAFSTPSCSSGNVCATGRCTACGDESLPCCAGRSNVDQCPSGNSRPSASPTLRCNGDGGTATCEGCGKAGEPCCQLFFTSDPSCNPGNACIADSCTACGNDGLPCCTGNTNTDQCPGADDTASLRCVRTISSGETTCAQCGREEQPCCQRNQFSEPECAAGLNCAGAGVSTLGECVRCGGLGQQCCASANGNDRAPCGRGAVCAGGRCLECGGLGQLCCASGDNDLRQMCWRSGHAMCDKGICTACGRPGEPCCTGDELGRITGVGVSADDFVCWSGAACPESRICPPDAVPAASAAEERLCAEDFAEAQLGVEGTFFDACVNTAANTECKDTVLAGAGGSRIIPDWCIDYSSTVDFPTFNCSGQVDDAPRYVYCAESSRTADCGNTLCQGGATECDTWSPRTALPSESVLYSLRPGVAGNRSPSSPLYMPAITCDGDLQLLTRPGLGNGLYSVVVNFELQTFPFCTLAGPCIDIPNQITPVTGTTIAWAANAGTPTDTPGATSKASATIFAQDQDGFFCVSPGVSYAATRIQFEITCLLLESPDDVPSGPLFPDAATET